MPRILVLCFLIFASVTCQAHAAGEVNYSPALFSSTQSGGGYFDKATSVLETMIEESAGQLVASQCCKTCRKGKACGNSCISRSKQCHKPRGCACDAN